MNLIPNTPPKAGTCAHCGMPASQWRGADIWPNARDIADKVFWGCRFCDAWVGSDTKGNALGTSANAELRSARTKMGDRLARLWDEALRHPAYASAREQPEGSPERIQAVAVIKGAARTRSYRFLGHRLGVEPNLARVAMMDLPTLRRAWAALRGVTYDEVRAWAEANPPPVPEKKGKPDAQ